MTEKIRKRTEHFLHKFITQWQDVNTTRNEKGDKHI